MSDVLYPLLLSLGLGTVLFPIALKIWINLKRPDDVADYYQSNYIDHRHIGRSEENLPLLSRMQEQIAQRKSDLEALAQEVEGLKAEREVTRSQILGLADRLSSIGLIEHNRRKFLFSLILSFCLGIFSSFIASGIYELLRGS